MLRNFWAQVLVDGGPPVATGPEGEDGGIAIEVLRRDLHELSTALRVVGWRENDTLVMDVIVGDEIVYHERTPIAV